MNRPLEENCQLRTVGQLYFTTKFSVSLLGVRFDCFMAQGYIAGKGLRAPGLTTDPELTN